MKYLITGGAGFIGSNLAHKLVEQGHEVLIFDNLGPGSSIHNMPTERPVEFRHLDLRSYSDILDCLTGQKIDYVVHLAAQSHVDRGLVDDLSFWQTQVMGTRNLFTAILETQPSVIKIINQGTDELYGEVEIGKAAPAEGSPFRPNPIYANSKAAQYFVGRAFVKTHNLPIVSTFPVNNFGPRQNEEKLIPKFIKNALEDKKLPLMKSFNNQRDWLPVDDMCSALTLLCEKGAPGEDYNIGCNNHRTNLEITKTILQHLGKDESLIEITPDRKTHDSRYAVNFDKITALGWKAEHTFDDYIKTTIEWYQRNYAF